MTGFGRAEVQNAQQKVTVEIKTVNHRYLEFNIKAPKKFSLFDSNIRKTLKDYAQRGKIDVFITYEDFTEGNVKLKYNAELAGEYVKYAKEIEESFGLRNDLSVSRMLSCPDVITQEEESLDEEALWSVLEAVVRRAGESLMQSRNMEGENLRIDLLAKLNHLDQNVDKVIEREPKIMEEYRTKLETKTKELLGDAQVEESRIATEVVLFADKICTDEETVRLKSHIQNMKDTLAIGDNIGRKLDFIAQEMNREANTILSKANDLETSNLGVELKTEIEKIREQIQNIE